MSGIHISYIYCNCNDDGQNLAPKVNGEHNNEIQVHHTHSFCHHIFN